MSIANNQSSERKWPRWLVATWAAVVLTGILVVGPSVVKVFASARIASEKAEKHLAMREINLAVIKFGTENDDRYPKFSSANEAADAIKPYLTDLKLIDRSEMCVEHKVVRAECEQA